MSACLVMGQTTHPTNISGRGIAHPSPKLLISSDFLSSIKVPQKRRRNSCSLRSSWSLIRPALIACAPYPNLRDYSKYVKALGYEPNTAYQTMTGVHEILDSFNSSTHLRQDLGKNEDCHNRYDTFETATAIVKLPKLENLIVHNVTRACRYYPGSATRELEILLRGV